MAKPVYSPLMLFSPISLSLSPLTFFSLHCSFCALPSLNFLLPLYLFKTKEALFPALSFCWKRMLSSIQHCHKLWLSVPPWGSLRTSHREAEEADNALAQPLGSIFLVPARSCCAYWEAPAKLLCLWDHLWEHSEQELLVFVLILYLAVTNNLFLCQLFSVWNHCSFFCICFLPDFFITLIITYLNEFLYYQWTGLNE